MNSSTKSSLCPTCNGKGETIETAFNRDTFCRPCKGRGDLLKANCKKCGGSGTIEGGSHWNRVEYKCDACN